MKKFKYPNSKKVITIVITSCSDKIFNTTIALLRSIALLSKSYVKILILRDSLENPFQKEVIIKGEPMLSHCAWVRAFDPLVRW